MESKNSRVVVDFKKCDISSYTKTVEYDQCIIELIKILKSFLNEDFEFYKTSDIENIAIQFLKIFNIDDVNNFTPDIINDKIKLVQSYIDKLYEGYRNELLFNMNIMCDIFKIISISDSMIDIKWDEFYCNPIYLYYNKQIFPSINNEKLQSIVNMLTNNKLYFNSIPKVYFNNYLDSNKCYDFTRPTILGLDDLEIPDHLKEFIKTIKNINIFSFHHGGQNEQYVNLLNCNQSDDCDDNLNINTIHKPSILDNLPIITNSSNNGYFKIYKIILDLINKTNYYKTIKDKIFYIIHLFNTVVFDSFNSDIDYLFQNIIVANIDLLFFKFANNFFIEQLKIDTLDQFSIERIIYNIANYYIEHSIKDRPYININSQHDTNKINLHLFICIFIQILNNTSSFYIDLKFLNTINIALLTCMTNRKTINCPNETIKNFIIDKIIETTTYNIQVLFTKESNSTIKSINGAIITFTISNNSDKVVLLN